MKIITATFWIFIFTFFYTSDTSVSQLPSVKYEIVTDSIIDHEMQLKELLSRIKLSYCDVLILSNKENLNILKNDNHVFKPQWFNIYNVKDSIQNELFYKDYFNKNH